MSDNNSSKVDSHKQGMGITKKLKQTTLIPNDNKIENQPKKLPKKVKTHKTDKIKITRKEFELKKEKYEKYRSKMIRKIIKNSNSKVHSLYHDKYSKFKSQNDGGFNTIEFISPYLENKDELIKLINKRDTTKLANEIDIRYKEELDDACLYADPQRHYEFNTERQNVLKYMQDPSKVGKWIEYYKKEANELEFEIIKDINDKENGKNVAEFPYQYVDRNNSNIEANNDDRDMNMDDNNSVDINKDNKIDIKEIEKNRMGLIPTYCVPIRADVRDFNFITLANKQKEISGRLFDVIMMDPPWELSGSNPTRGVALGYQQLSDDFFGKIPVDKLIDDGLLFIWVINAKYNLALQLFRHWGFNIINDIAWVKQTVNRRQAHGHGYYLQHAKETCLVGIKGNANKILNSAKYGLCSDVIYAERKGQSQKPIEIYELIERIVPKGYYLEIFGRRNNLRNGWVTVGNEL